jgi:hypothetical protein
VTGQLGILAASLLATIGLLAGSLVTGIIVGRQAAAKSDASYESGWNDCQLQATGHVPGEWNPRHAGQRVVPPVMAQRSANEWAAKHGIPEPYPGARGGSGFDARYTQVGLCGRLDRDGIACHFSAGHDGPHYPKVGLPFTEEGWQPGKSFAEHWEDALPARRTQGESQHGGSGQRPGSQPG